MLLLLLPILILLPNGIPGLPGLDGIPGQARPPPHVAPPPLPPHQAPIAAAKVPLGARAGTRVPPRPSKILLPPGTRRLPSGRIPSPPLSPQVDFKLKPSGFQPVVPLRSDEEVISRLVGKQVRTAKYSNAAFYEKSGRPVLDSRELSCSFNGECCWANAEYPSDQLQWRLAEGKPNRNKFNSFFGPFRGRRIVPEGRYLVLGAHGSVASDEAQLVSCLITCSEGPIMLRARHWSTPNTLLRVCRRNGFEPEGPLFDCVELPRVQSPGPTEVAINAPQSAPTELVIVAANLIGSQGDAAILDDIRVRYTPCRGPIHRPPGPPPQVGQPRFLGEGSPLQPLPGLNTPPPPVHTPSPPVTETLESLGTPECAKGSCDFESSDGDYYAAVELPDRTKAALATDAILESDRVVRFKYYEATDGIQLFGCCDTTDTCPFETGKSVNPADRTWRTGNFICPSGTRQIIFLCDNTRTNVGVCGLDSIRMYATPESNRPEDAEIPC